MFSLVPHDRTGHLFGKVMKELNTSSDLALIGIVDTRYCRQLGQVDYLEGM